MNAIKLFFFRASLSLRGIIRTQRTSPESAPVWWCIVSVNVKTSRTAAVYVAVEYLSSSSSSSSVITLHFVPCSSFHADNCSYDNKPFFTLKAHL